MERYLNLGGRSNVLEYEIGPDYISVIFKGTARIYTYSYKGAGAANVEEMKRLARAGQGLNAFIKRYVNQLYDK